MNQNKFKKLKVGDKVTLAKPLENYSGGSVWDTPRFIKAGTEGVVGAANVPAVTGRERNFVCVDFPDMEIEYKTAMGESRTLIPRVGAFKDDLI